MDLNVLSYFSIKYKSSDIYFITFMLGIVWANKKQILHSFGEDDIMRKNASCSNTQPHYCQ